MNHQPEQLDNFKTGIKVRLFLRSAFLIFSFTLAVKSYSQEFIHYTQESGLPSNKVYMVTPDYQGFIWCTTNKGIAMFNGEKFKIYTTQDGLPVNDLWKLYADKKGRVWYFGKSSELGYIQKGRVYRFPSSDGSVINPTNFDITDERIGIIGSGGSYWLENGKWQFYGIKKIVSEFIQGSDAPAFYNYYIDIKNNHVLRVGNNNLLFLDTNLAVKYSGKIEGSSMEMRNAAPSMFLIDQRYFYCLVNERILCFDFNKNELKTILLNQYFDEKQINQMYIYYAEGHIVLNGPAGRYLIKNDSLIQSISPLWIEDANPSGFFTDSLDNTWISTPNDGLYMYPMYNKQLRYFNKENVQHLEVFQGNIYAGVENKGLFEMNGKSLTKVELEGMYFYELTNLGDTALKFVTNREVGLYSPRKITILNFTGRVYSVATKKIYDAIIGNYKALHIENGIYYLASGSSFLQHDNKTNPIYMVSGVYHITKYKDVLLLGSTTGVKVFNGHSIWQVPVHTTTQINKLVVLTDYVLIATEGKGVYSYREKLELIDGTKSFFVNNIRKITDSVAWISTTMGAHEIKLRDGKFVVTRSVLKSNGLPSNFVNDIIIRNDSMFVATNNGMCILRMKDLKLNAIPDIQITSITANDSSFAMDSTVEIANRGNNNISINFDISYLHEHKQLRNYYKLEPVDPNWTLLGSHTLVLNGLKPGRYKVLIRSEGFNQNVNETSIDIAIHPRWYETTLFWIITVGWVAIFIFLIIFYVITNSIKKRDKKHSLENKMINLELDALRSKLNPHFIFNTFNAIQLFINNNQMDLSEKYLILLSKHIRNVFEFSHLQNITLEKEISLLKDYLEIEKIRFGDKINIEIEVDPGIDIQHTVIPSMMIQPFVENTMVHGLFHKKGIGRLHLKFMFVNETIFQVQIIDDGVGFVEKQSERISSTKVLTERVGLINQGNEFNVKIEKTFLDETKENKGTIITITIKHGK
jgi:hypothetical protein